ncbi:DUF3095 domain-containing protein [Rhizobiales bacterium Sp-1]|uniref:DUF3095 domain-containing protein n=1 Tax=Segnochrobactrum spirostomi TaxID=2608987 RepID=A0A6A7XZF8_9HYPH|nr:DUF3095 domain-containing protein [Segnochrobactrum spirostomi]
MRTYCDPFYAGLVEFDGFGRITETALYKPLPAGWVVGATDVVSSTGAIDRGHYKIVNTAGAAVIAALSNALDHCEFPYVFGGDGASFALPGHHADTARRALAATSAWARDELGLDLRAALTTIEEIRADGADVRIARFAASADVSYAMFSGGGLAFLEREMKRGRFAVPPAAPGTAPDLSNLSCRFDEIPAAHEVIVSFIFVPAERADPKAFSERVDDILNMIAASDEAEQPMSEAPAVGWPPAGLEAEARALRSRGWPLWLRRAAVGVRSLLSYFAIRHLKRIGPFDAGVYLRQIHDNSDFRKYDDGLKMTLDCTARFADALEARLREAADSGLARYGLHRQAAALMTCFVPSPLRPDHVHFIDGAAGGYASAARSLKA